MTVRKDIPAEAILSSLEQLWKWDDLWRQDREAHDIDKFELHFAVDADVLSMFLDPENDYAAVDLFGQYARKPRTKPKHSSARAPGDAPMEPDDAEDKEDEGGAILARLLSDFIFLSEMDKEWVAPRRTYALIPPHNEEVASIMIAIAQRANRASDNLPRYVRKVREDLTGVFEEYEKSKNKEAFAASLIERAPWVIRLYTILINSVTAIGRFMQLDRNKVVVLSGYKRNESEYLVHADPAEIARYVDGSVSEWYERLSEVEAPATSKDRERQANDARVLATLDYVNQSLFEDKRRLILITATPYIYRALGDYRPRKRNYNPDDSRSFASLFLRHPQWLLFHPSFFSTTGPSESEINLNRWLEILSAGRASTRLNVHDKNDLGSLPLELDSLVRQFATRKYGERVGSVLSVGRHKINAAVINGLGSLIQSKQWRKGNLAEVLRKPATDSLSKLYTTSTFLGLIEHPDGNANQYRAMPALCFDYPYQGFDRYYAEIRSLLRQDGDKRAEALARVRKLLEEIDADKIDITYYHRHIIHAAAYAMSEQWRPVLTLCRLAIKIADDVMASGFKGPQLDVVRGREAAFLATIAQRRSAKKISQLDEAERFLEVAKARDNKPNGQVDIRFESEGFAIRVRRFHFRYLVERDNKALPRAKELAGALEVLISKVRRITASEGSSECSQAANWVLLQSYTNLFTLLLILVYAGDMPTLHAEHGKLLEDFTVLLDNNKTEAYTDSYMAMVRDLTRIWLGVASEQVHEKIRGRLADAMLRGAETKIEYVIHRNRAFEAILDRFGKSVSKLS
jgi:hypothetical protein